MKGLLVSLMSPKVFFARMGRLTPWLATAAMLCLSYALVSGLFLVPPDYQQGDAFRMIYVHVPCASLSLGLYLAMALFSAITYIWRVKMADLLAKHTARIGMAFTFLALATGAIWGKPMWGTYWVWDGRLTSELILFFLYAGIVAMRSSLPDPFQAARACALLSLVGVINLPVIHYSVYWWHSLHQKSTLLGFHKPTMSFDMLMPLLVSLLGFALLAAWLVIQHTRADLLASHKI